MKSFTQKELIEVVAETIFNYEMGVDPNEYEKATGKEKPLWKTRYPFQENITKLEQHEQDDYRYQARMVIEKLMFLDLLSICATTEPRGE